MGATVKLMERYRIEHPAETEIHAMYSVRPDTDMERGAVIDLINATCEPRGIPESLHAYQCRDYSWIVSGVWYIER